MPTPIRRQWLPVSGVGSNPFGNVIINANNIVGQINAQNIGAINASSIVGLINAGQIGSVSAGTIQGQIQATQIAAVSATSITGTISAAQIGSVNSTAIAGTITAAQIGSVNATSITGVIVTAQLQDQIMNTLAKFAPAMAPIQRVASLPSLPSANYPSGVVVLNAGDNKLYKSNGSAWSVVSASTTISGQLTAGDIASVNANAITGLIFAAQINSIAANQITGQLTATQIYQVNASSITGTISAAQIGTVNASSIQGTLTSNQIGSVSAATITVGQIIAGQINSVNVNSIQGWGGATITVNAALQFTTNFGTVIIGGSNSCIVASQLISADTLNANTAINLFGHTVINNSGSPTFVGTGGVNSPNSTSYFGTVNSNGYNVNSSLLFDSSGNGTFASWKIRNTTYGMDSGGNCNANQFVINGNWAIADSGHNGAFANLYIAGIPNFSGGVSSAASAGGFTLPTNPAGFINVQVNGASYRVPYYNV